MKKYIQKILVFSVFLLLLVPFKSFAMSVSFDYTGTTSPYNYTGNNAPLINYNCPQGHAVLIYNGDTNAQSPQLFYDCNSQDNFFNSLGYLSQDKNLYFVEVDGYGQFALLCNQYAITLNECIQNYPSKIYDYGVLNYDINDQTPTDNQFTINNVNWANKTGWIFNVPQVQSGFNIFGGIAHRNNNNLAPYNASDLIAGASGALDDSNKTFMPNVAIVAGILIVILIVGFIVANFKTLTKKEKKKQYTIKIK